MNTEHVKGIADDIKGKTKEATGHAFGDRKLEAEGKVDQVKGAAHKAVGDIKDAAKH
jgi:uncharacterized protein YjbJ (UPF0337 family)